MAREKIKLTIQKLRKGKLRYRKMVKGKLWLSTTYDCDSRRNRSEAWQQFVAWRDEEPPRATSREELEARYIPPPDRGIGCFAKWGFADGNELIRQGASLAEVPYADLLKYVERRTQQCDLAVGKVASAYISILEARFTSGQCSAGLYGQTRTAINLFVDWFGRERSMDEIDETEVTAYNTYLLSLIGDRKQVTISTYQKLWRSFIENACQDLDLAPPRNLRSRRHTIKPTAPKVETWSVEEVEAFLDLASPKLELHLLLMLNTGMTQQDISDLQAEEVDWTEGRIVRSRSKEKNAPTINWLLWRQTFHLLSEQGTRQGRVFTKANGDSLVSEGIKADGNVWHNDAIRSNFRHLVRKAKKHDAVPADWHKTLKQLRKTGASILETGPHAEFVDVFFDHSRVARRHYLRGQVVPKFDDAVEWLGQQLGIK